MASKSAEFLIAMLSGTALVLAPVTAQAGGQMGHFGNGGQPGVSNLRCPEAPRPNFMMSNRSLTINKTNTINNVLNVYKPINIDNSKNINININGSASANATAGFNNSSFFGNFGVSSYVAEAPGMVAGGEVNLNVSPAEAVAACIFQDATVIKAIHAICVSDDRHEFPASHMVGDTWINAGYEGELARCLPGSSLKVTVGSVVQSSEGAAVSNTRAETMMCAPREALRHFKNGVLKCAPAMAVPDCTERTNLRKFGTGDMFFSYVTRVCLETGRELVGGISREDEIHGGRSYRQSSLRGSGY